MKNQLPRKMSTMNNKKLSNRNLLQIARNYTRGRVTREYLNKKKLTINYGPYEATANVYHNKRRIGNIGTGSGAH